MSEKGTDISINVELDENKVPQKIMWSAPGAGVDNAESKAIILSMWDKKDLNAMRMDL